MRISSASAHHFVLLGELILILGEAPNSPPLLWEAIAEFCLLPEEISADGEIILSLNQAKLLY